MAEQIRRAAGLAGAADDLDGDVREIVAAGEEGLVVGRVAGIMGATETIAAR